MKKALKITLAIFLILTIAASALLIRGYVHYKSDDFESLNLYAHTHVLSVEKNIVTWNKEISWGIKSIKSCNWHIQADENIIKNSNLEQWVIEHLENDLQTKKEIKPILIKHILQLIGIY